MVLPRVDDLALPGPANTDPLLASPSAAGKAYESVQPVLPGLLGLPLGNTDGIHAPRTPVRLGSAEDGVP